MRLLIVDTVLVLLCCFCVVSGKNEEFRSRRAVVTTSSSASSTGGYESSCENVKTFFSMRNISLNDIDNSKVGGVCGGQCCDIKTETILRKQGQNDFATLLRHNSRALQGSLTSTAETLQNHVLELASQSENKTLQLFSQVYQVMAVLSREPITAFYKDIRDYILVNSTKGDLSTPPLDIKESVLRFFTDLFPLAYHNEAGTPKRDFTLNYKDCLKRSMETVLPFGDVPRTISQSLSKSLEVTRLLLQALSIGSNVLNTTDSLLIDKNGSSECHDALLKLSYCPKCQGMVKNTKPCSGFCLNVIRGCITKYVAELDAPWSGYVEGVESLVNAVKKNNNDPVLRNLDTTISSAIMFSMGNIKEIDAKVKRSCRTAEFSDREDPLMVEASTPTPTPSSGRPSRMTSPRNFSPFPEQTLTYFLNSIGKTKGFYGSLADTLCRDKNFAEQRDQSCWNGERVADYTKTIADIGLGMQKYNPEVKPNPIQLNGDPKLEDIVEKLRHVQKMAVKSLGSAYIEDYMQQDGADGSGSGAGPNMDDDDENENVSSGSGYGPTDTDQGISRTNYKPDEVVPHVIIAGASTARPTLYTASISISLAIMVYVRNF